ncbi:MAG: glutamate-5-semialdehyde dehydrogenase [Defluviitaleaceae bacterium]|nr:glutamate-5-semialdehyde dehydrogenase [Defluviitaleaceae bacterium]
MTIIEQAEKVKIASQILVGISAEQLNQALNQIATALLAHEKEIIAANELDMEQGRLNRTPDARLDRLMLNEARIKGMASDVSDVAKLPDVLGDFQGFTRPNGLKVTKLSVPLGVVGMIYESRPNVTVDAAILCLKSGNAVLLRGGKEAHHSNQALVNVIKSALVESGLPADAVELVQDTSRETATQMMKLDGYLDLLIPRGGAALIQSVKEHATVPIIETGTGNCHIYINEFADLQMALDILINAKVQRPSVCNACENVVIDKAVASDVLPLIKAALEGHGVQLRGCQATTDIIAVQLASADDFYTEYNDLLLSIKVVDHIDEAILHINEHGTKHSEAIVTENQVYARRFLQRIDAACVYHNASTRFSDGAALGFGAEIGISTQKLHARGPFALKELTTYKYVIEGTGQVRK